MPEFSKQISLSKEELKELGLKYDHELFVAIAKSIGPAIYNSEACVVFVKDRVEIDKVKNSFLIKKLKLKDTPELFNILKETVNLFEKINEKPYRVSFYYVLVVKFDKKDVFLRKQENYSDVNIIDRITLNPKVHKGKPTIRSMRFTVANMLELLAGGMSYQEILEDYPFLEMEDIQACLLYASMLANTKTIKRLSA